MLRKTLSDNQLFFIPYAILLLFSAIILITVEKGEIHLYTNQYHTAFFDILFAFLTYLGDGWFIIIPALILLFFSLRHSVFLITAYFSTGLVTQILKRIFFEDVLRPSKLLEDADLYLIEGVDMLSGRSFPSGHATSAFALFLCLALIAKNRVIKFLCLIFACLVAYSRVYLSQHFLIDISVGSIIGSAGAFFFYVLYYKDDRRWHEWSIKKAFTHERQA
ncbi:MAG TPA: phosphatase PAP2 family protein [Bacteroidales bacterium]|jgi:membrane-associated phospholipid phosphatase|nr:phosphatase PAP2 family protein [Bacteroidales bacterium]